MKKVKIKLPRKPFTRNNRIETLERVIAELRGEREPQPGIMDFRTLTSDILRFKYQFFELHVLQRLAMDKGIDCDNVLLDGRRVEKFI